MSSIAFDAADDDVEPRDDEDEEDDEGYWIEGPTGEDIRSAWRGQPVHLLVVSALLHPRATNLPAHAQAAYVQSAMKVFVRACADCEEQDITAIVGVIRSKLGVFLQVTCARTFSCLYFRHDMAWHSSLLLDIFRKIID